MMDFKQLIFVVTRYSTIPNGLLHRFQRYVCRFEKGLSLVLRDILVYLAASGMIEGIKRNHGHHKSKTGAAIRSGKVNPIIFGVVVRAWGRHNPFPILKKGDRVNVVVIGVPGIGVGSNDHIGH